MPEQTAPQTVGYRTNFGRELAKTRTTSWHTKVRAMRLQPTIALARKMIIAPALAAAWSVETTPEAPDGAKDLIEDVFIPARLRLLETAMLGTIDFGWQPFEKVFMVNADKKIVISKFKPLLQDLTDILVRSDTGAFDGLRNDRGDGSYTDLSLGDSLLFSINVEGTDWYGNPDMKNLEASYDQWTDVNAAANRYDKKVAGSNWVVHYPIGYSLLNGVRTANDLIADQLLSALEASSTIKVPRYVEQFSESLDDDARDAWKIELITDGGSVNAAFIDRQGYLDKLFIRGIGLPERSVLEGQFGTKAEAEAHGDFGVTNIELRHTGLVQDINWHAVNQLLRLNYGVEYENTVFLSPAPLSDPARAFLKEIFAQILATPEGIIDILDNLDLKAFSKQLNLPLNQTDEDFGDKDLVEG